MSDTPKPASLGNVYFSLVMAITGSTASITEQQGADAQTTVQYGKLESRLNDYFYQLNGFNPQWRDSSGNIVGPMPSTPAQWAAQMQKDAQWVAGNKDNPASQTIIPTDQSQYNAANAVASSQTSYVNSVFQQANSQVSTDSSNIQQSNQVLSMMNIMGFLANLMSKG